MSSNAQVSASSLRVRFKQFIEHSTVQRALLALILINALILGLETSSAVMATIGAPLMLLDKAILGIFVIEIILRLFVHRLAFFKDGWSVFDFIVVAIALLPASGPFAVVRALRVLRVLRVLSFVPSMRKIVGALMQSLNGMLSISMVLGLIFYVSAVMATKLFGEAFPVLFGDLTESTYTLFQIMTMDSWSSGIARPIMEQFPYAWAFFIPFILIATFTMLNLFIAVIVSAVQSIHDEEHKDEIDTQKQVQQQLLEQMQQLQKEISQLRSQIK